MFRGLYEPNNQLVDPLRISYDKPEAVRQLSLGLDIVLARCAGQDIVVVCVGTDRSTGDAFGPIIGSRLARGVTSRRVSIYGTLESPVHAVNLRNKLDDIAYFHRNKPHSILAIDACLGKFEHVGQIVLEQGPLRPGAGVKKTLPEFGAFTLTGVVNVAGFMEYFVLQNTRLGIVMQMTDVVVEAFAESLQKFELLSDAKELPGVK